MDSTVRLTNPSVTNAAAHAVINNENPQRATAATVLSEPANPQRTPANATSPATTTHTKVAKVIVWKYCWHHGRCFHSGETCNAEPRLTKEQYGPSITWENRDSHGGSQKDSKSRHK